MKLSEAIRLGAMLRQQAYGTLESTRRRWFGLFGAVEPKGTCALGAAFEAAKCSRRQPREGEGRGTPFRGSLSEVDQTLIIQHEWPVLNAATACPQCGEMAPLYRLIPHLNDEHRWLLEHIAQFVEKVEGIVASSQSVTLSAEDWHAIQAEP